MSMQVLERQAVPESARWNKTSMFADDEAWQVELENVRVSLQELQAFPNTLDQGAQRLAEWMTLSQAISTRIYSLYFYAVMSASVDAQDATAKAQIGQVSALVGQVGALTAFFEPEILALGEDKVMDWVRGHQDLASYEKYFADIFRSKDHVLGADVERVLGMAQEPFGMVSRSANELTNTDLRFADASTEAGEDYAVNQGSLPLALKGADRTLRASTWQSFADGYLGMKNTLATLYMTSVKQNNMQASLRGYDNALHRQLAPHNIPEDVFHNLISTYQKHLPVWHKYWDVKRRALKQDDIAPYDIWAPIVDNEPAMTFEEAVDMIATGMQPLGEEYVATLKRGCLEQGWVDYMPNQGKRQGAFSGGSYTSYPFIMMSFDDGLRGMSTLAHELGHSMHSYYSRANQPPVFAQYSMFVAEVASNFNQALVRAHLFEARKDDPAFLMALIEEAMGNFHRYFFIMPTLARFEWTVHQQASEGKPLTADHLNGIMSDYFAEGYGDAFNDDPTRTGITWAQFGHLYVPFYTFQYATGISAAHALAEKVLAGDEEAAQNYLQFLKTGSALHPIEALKVAGVDMSTPDAVEKTYGVLAEMIDRLDSLVTAS
jgi:oligoendopeptidase F